MPNTCKALGWIPSSKEGGREEGGNKGRKADIHLHVNALQAKGRHTFTCQMLGLEGPFQTQLQNGSLTKTLSGFSLTQYLVAKQA